jgi:hypothetical protein
LDIESLISVISGQETSWAILFSALTILIYDHLLLLPLETQKIWKADGTPVKWIYIANRIISWMVIVLGIISKFVFFELSLVCTAKGTFGELIFCVCSTQITLASRYQPRYAVLAVSKKMH